MFSGCCTALITPFDDKNSINYVEFERIIEHQIKAGVSALLFLGTTGESATLTDQEKCDIVNFAVKTVNHRVPVIVGAGTNDTCKTIKQCKLYQSLGADALLIVAPYYNKTTQRGLIEHYKLVASSVNCPIIIYNVPSRTGINIEPKTIIELSYIKNIVGLKQASNNMQEVMDIVAGVSKDFYIYSGEDSLTYCMMCLGAKGVISVVSNIMPEYVVDMCKYFMDDKLNQSLNMQLKLNPLIKSLFFEVNPIPIKFAMNYVGYNVGEPRLPLVKMENTKQLSLMLKEFFDTNSLVTE